MRDPAFPQLLSVVERRYEATDIVSLRLAPEGGGALAAAIPGQAISLRLADTKQPRPCTYSLSRSPSAPTYRISIKRPKPSAAFSCGMLGHDGWTIGTRLEASLPFGNLTLGDPPPPIVALIAAGIGITPFMSILHDLAERATPTGRVILRYMVRDEAAHPFRLELAAIRPRLPGLDVRTWYSRSTTGRLTREGLLGSLPNSSALDAVLLCGPPGFVADARAWVMGAGVPEARIRDEAFGGNPKFPGAFDPTPTRQIRPPLVTFARSGVVAPWDEKGGPTTILELGEEQGLRLPSRCRSGMCGACAVPLVVGTVAYPSAPQCRPKAGEILTCCSTPTSDLTIDV